ncbi:hypothetical protein RJ640_016735 [Escallonia rubra]|uniref:ABC transporter B family member 29, chloroplastic n=1 Tax=Escallonia rubra TaxID=112253 RepID=A0AA88U7J7_9ASTE|nr:hypothetical protein RJ640_016735 [Escallonia rubra]
MSITRLIITLPNQPPSLYHLKLNRTPTNPITPRPKTPPKTLTPIKSSTPATPLPISNSFSTLRSIKPYLQSQHQSILKAYLCSAVSVYSLSQIIPRIGTFSTLMSSTIDAVRLRNEGSALAVLFLVKTAATYLQQAFLWEAALSSVHRIRVHVFERVLRRDLGFFEGGDGVSSGDIAYRITAEASDVADTVYAVLNTIVPSTLQLIALATQMLVISPTLSFISALVIPSMALVVAYLGEKLHKISKEANLSVAALSAYLNEVLPSIIFVKANNAELRECARFQRLAGADLSKRLKKKIMKALVPQIAQICYFGLLFIFCFGSLIISRGSFGCSSMDVGKAYNEFKQGEPAIERLFNLSEFESQVIEKPDAVELVSVTGEVKFCNVSFRYGDSVPFVLNGLDLHIKAGETVAVVGPSGGGKTTLMKLLLRLYDPQSGCILVDSHDVRNVRLESLRRHVGLVSQDITLFSGTIAENVGYVDLMTNIDMARVELAARMANAAEFIEKLPNQYATNIGPRGSILSGGQRQRLAIARAIYQNSSVLVLDEATSALDSRSELLVRQAVQRLMGNHTVLVIAHRLETVLMAGRVFHLEDGKLQEISRSSLLDAKHDLFESAGLSI